MLGTIKLKALTLFTIVVLFSFKFEKGQQVKVKNYDVVLTIINKKHIMNHKFEKEAYYLCKYESKKKIIKGWFSEKSLEKVK